MMTTRGIHKRGSAWSPARCLARFVTMPHARGVPAVHRNVERPAMSDLLARAAQLRARFASGPGASVDPAVTAVQPTHAVAGLDSLRAELESLSAAVTAQASQLERLRQDVADAEHARDAANLSRMRVVGQLNTLQKTLLAATPDFAAEDHTDAQHAQCAGSNGSASAAA